MREPTDPTSPQTECKGALTQLAKVCIDTGMQISVTNTMNGSVGFNYPGKYIFKCL